MPIRSRRRSHSEEEPEPDEEPDEEPETASAAPAGMVPTVGGSAGRDYEFRTELLSIAQVADGKTLGELLTKSSADNWDLVDVIDAGDQRVILLRKVKRTPRDSRPVGFSVPR